MKRLFIGIPIVSEKAVQLAEIWRNDQFLNQTRMSWVKPDNWHITLFFLGDTPESAVDLLQQMIDESFSRVETSISGLSGVGVFPNNHNPKVLWLGLDNFEFLMPAYTILREMLTQNGFLYDNKSLKPHLSLARVRNQDHRTSFEPWLNEYRHFNFGPVTLSRVVLFESILTPQGSVYKPLFVKELDNNSCRK